MKRPPFGSYSNVEDWELKVVKKHFDCSVVSDSDKFACAEATLGIGRGADDTEPPRIISPKDALDSDGYAYATEEFAVDALYLVEFDEQVRVDLCPAGAQWTQLLQPTPF